MYNWSTDEKNLRDNTEKYAIWKLEQVVNFGLNGERISQVALRKYWERLSIDPSRKRFLQVLLDIPQVV
jgi:hypothetical protein